MVDIHEHFVVPGYVVKLYGADQDNTQLYIVVAVEGVEATLYPYQIATQSADLADWDDVVVEYDSTMKGVNLELTFDYDILAVCEFFRKLAFLYLHMIGEDSFQSDRLFDSWDCMYFADMYRHYLNLSETVIDPETRCNLAKQSSDIEIGSFIQVDSGNSCSFYLVIQNSPLIGIPFESQSVGLSSNQNNANAVRLDVSRCTIREVPEDHGHITEITKSLRNAIFVEMIQNLESKKKLLRSVGESCSDI